MADTETGNSVSASTNTEFDTNQSSSKDTEMEDKAERSSNEIPEDVLKLAKAEIEKSLNNVIDSVSPKEDGPEDESDDIFVNGEVNPVEQNGFPYVEPIQDPYEKSIQYLEKHNILQLFQTLTTNIVFKKPNDPLDFMIGEIGELKKNYKSPEPK